jgi:hypothetical protein
MQLQLAAVGVTLVPADLSAVRMSMLNESHAAAADTSTSTSTR